MKKVYASRPPYDFKDLVAEAKAQKASYLFVRNEGPCYSIAFMVDFQMRYQSFKTLERHHADQLVEAVQDAVSKEPDCQVATEYYKELQADAEAASAQEFPGANHYYGSKWENLLDTSMLCQVSHGRIVYDDLGVEVLVSFLPGKPLVIMAKLIY